MPYPRYSTSVINLDRRSDRMAFMAKSLSDLGVEYTRIPAVDAKDPSNDWLTEGQASKVTGLTMQIGEHAVHASHCAAWADAVERGLDAVVVLEDDAIVSPDFASLFKEAWVPDDADVVKLEAYFGEVEMDRHGHKVFAGRELLRLRSHHYGAAGYLVTAKGLEKLIAWLSPEVADDPVDVALFDRRSPLFQEMTVYQMIPAMVIQAEFLEGHDGIRDSDLIGDRLPISSAAYAPASSLSRRLRYAVLRGRSRMRGRKRLAVSYA